MKRSSKPSGFNGPRRKAARLGQHFLMHPQIAERIVAAAKLPRGARVLEVGPGRGILTRALLKEGARVIAVETDRLLFEKLTVDFAEEVMQGKLKLLHADIRHYPLNSAIAENEGYSVVANIPY